MYLLKQMFNPIEKLDDLWIYEFHSNKWQLTQIIKIRTKKHLSVQLRNIACRLDYAVIEMSQPYRNTFYYLYPDIKIIINKSELVSLFHTTIEERTEVFDEAAAAVENASIYNRLNRDWHYFIEEFYKMPSKEEAIKLYELWQTYVPLNNKKISRFIRTMEFYFDEIMNYFDILGIQTDDKNNLKL